jgi:hypothetical protein
MPRSTRARTRPASGPQWSGARDRPGPPGQHDHARGDIRAHTVVSRPAVDVLVVIDHGVERHTIGIGVRRARAQVLVEHRLPRGGLVLGGLRAHAARSNSQPATLSGKPNTISQHARRPWRRSLCRPSFDAAPRLGGCALGRLPAWRLFRRLPCEHRRYRAGQWLPGGDRGRLPVMEDLERRAVPE